MESVASGGYASDSLLVRSEKLSSRDAGLAAQIVFGTLRWQGQLDFLITHFSGRPAHRLDEHILIALRTGIFQLRYLERVPAYAAVGESVEYVKTRARSAGGLVNAVLRKIHREPITWPDAATALSCPSWLLQRWTVQFGAPAAEGIARAALTEPDAYIRLAPGDQPPQGVPAEPTEIAGCFRLTGEPSIPVRLHDIGSQSVLPKLDLRPAHTYLDLCAAPGNKMRQALEIPLSLAVACDLSASRLRDMGPLCSRVLLDATNPLPFTSSFDRIFVDAPCSGTGTLARNPEIKWRVQSEDFRRFRERQVSILLQAAQCLKGEGKLLYATCSLEREENEDVRAEVLAQRPDLCCIAEDYRMPGRDEGDGFYSALFKPST